MTIQQLRAQIAALQDATMDENRNFRSAYDEGKFDALSAVDALLDSLQEEPVSEDLNTAAKSYSNNLDNICGSIGKQTRNAFKAGAEWQKEKDESCSNDLGEYINELSKQFSEVSFAKLSRIAVRVAKWQKEQDEKTFKNRIINVYNRGREQMKQQMMAKAIDAQVLENYDGKVIRYDETILDEKLSDCKVFDKVKVIVVEERNEL